MDLMTTVNKDALSSVVTISSLYPFCDLQLISFVSPPPPLTQVYCIYSSSVFSSKNILQTSSAKPTVHYCSAPNSRQSWRLAGGHVEHLEVKEAHIGCGSLRRPKQS